MHVGPIDRRNTRLRLQVYDRVRAAIMDGTLQPGQPLQEADLARQLDISLPTLREAIALLEHDEYIYSIPYKGIFVRPLTRREIDEYRMIREDLEARALRLAMDHMSEDILGRLEVEHRAAEEAVRRGDQAAHYRLVDLFHEAILDHCGNATLARMVRSLRGRVRLYLKFAGITFEASHMLATLHEQIEIIDSIRRRDTEEAVSRLISHMRRSFERTVGTYPAEISDQTE